MYLYDTLVCPYHLTDRFFFLSPHRTNFLISDKDNLKKGIVDMLVANQVAGKLVLAPYNTG